MTAIQRYEERGLDAISLDERSLVRHQLEMASWKACHAYDGAVWYRQDRVSPDEIDRLEMVALKAIEACEIFPPMWRGR